MYNNANRLIVLMVVRKPVFQTIEEDPRTTTHYKSKLSLEALL